MAGLLIKEKKMKKFPPGVSYQEQLIKSLRDPEEAAGYLNAALEENNRKLFLHALRNVLEAQGGLTRAARTARLNRVSLYKMLASNGNPGFENILRLLQAAGICLYVKPSRNSKLKIRKKAA